MNLDKDLENLFLNISIEAALSSYYFVGKKDKMSGQSCSRYNENRT